jgi:ATP/maltotriose-dependent transcriptional regulator MalT
MSHLQDLPFIGRDPELGRLSQLFINVQEERGRVVLIEGPAGTGKSRLVEAGLEGVDSGIRVARGQAFQLETPAPYGLFAEALAPLVRELSPDQLDLLTRGWSAELAVLLPGVLPAPTASAGLEALTSEEASHRLRWILSDFVQRLAQEHPIVFALDDLQWADEQSLELLHFLGRSVHETPVGVVGVVRAGPGDDPPLAFHEMKGSLQRLGVLESLDLGPLDETEVRELLAETFALAGSTLGEVTSDVYTWTGGNPLVIQELLRGWVEHEVIRPEGDVWVGWTSRTVVSPQGLGAMVRSRMALLDPSVAGVLEAAAAVGKDVPYSLLSEVTALDSSALGPALDTLVRAGFLRETPQSRPPSYRFAHPLLHAAVYERASEARRVELHTRIASALLAAPGSALPVEVARQVLRANQTELPESAGELLLEVGAASASMHADRLALDCFRTALAGADTEDARARASMGVALAFHRLGRYEEGDAVLDALLDSARERDDHCAAARLLRRRGMARYFEGGRESALEWLTQALSEAEDCGDEALRVRILLSLGATYQELGRLTEAEGALEEGLAVVGADGDPALISRLERSLFLAKAWGGGLEEAREHGTRAEEAARASNRADLLWAVTWARAVVSGLHGDGEDFQAAIGELQGLEEALQSPVHRLLLYELESQLAWAFGRWDEGLVVGEEAVDLARALNHSPLLARLLVWTAGFLIRRGELDRASSYVDEAVELSEDAARAGSDIHARVSALAGQAMLAMERGDYAEASDLAGRGLGLAREVGFVAWGTFRLLPVLTESLFREGRIDEGRELGRRLRADADRVGHRLGMAWADAADGLAAWLSSESDSGETLELAADALDEIPMLPDAARLRRQAAGRWADAGDRERALENLRKAHDQLAQMRALPELEKARHMYREIGARPPVVAAEEGPAGLTERELEIATLAAEGRSNKAIGRALGISPRTVGTHLSRIYRKLGISSRAALANSLRG